MSASDEKSLMNQPTLHFSCTYQNSGTKPSSTLAVDEIVGCFVLSISCARDNTDETFPIPAGVKYTMENIYFLMLRENSVSRPTWKQCAYVIHFVLHPAFANGDIELASIVFKHKLKLNNMHIYIHIYIHIYLYTFTSV